MSKVSIEPVIAGKKYRLRWREGGKQPSRTVNGTERTAQRLAIQIEDRLEAGIPDASKLTVNDVAIDYFRAGKSRWSDKTRVGYLQEYNANVKADLGEVKIAKLRKIHVDNWLAAMSKRKVGRASQRKALQRLRAIIKFAMGHDLVMRNVAELAEMPKPPVPKVIDPPTAEEIERARTIYLSRGQLRDATIWSLLGYQTTRPGEVFGLRAKCVDLENAKLRIDARLTLELGDDEEMGAAIADGDKRLLSRSIDLHPSVVADLREYMLSIGNPTGDELVFPYEKTGEPMTKSQYDSWRRNRFKRTAKAAGISADVTPYILRHAAVSIALHCIGVHRIAYIAGQAGHSQTMLLRTYSHEIDGMEETWGLSVEQVIQNARAAVAGERKLAIA